MHLRSLNPEQLGRLNSATKYPSIPTYHMMGKRGRLVHELAVEFTVRDMLSLTEKIDGTNARIIVFPDREYVIGSREEFLTAKGDLIPNLQLGIVDALQDALPKLEKRAWEEGPSDAVLILYGEAYGGNIGKSAKQYTSTGSSGFRLFDIAILSLDELEHLLSQEREDISRWRQAGRQTFLNIETVAEFCDMADLELVPLLQPRRPPESVQGTYDWLNEILGGNPSAARLDPNAGGRPEGVVLRTMDRSKIVKMRLEDYARTLGVGR